MDISFSEIKTFNAVVRSGSFTAAAKMLGVSQPAITAQMRKLEGRSQYPLLERFSKQVRPTAVGRQLFTLSCQYLDLNLAVASLLEPEVRQEDFQITLATSTPQILIPLVAVFKQQYPNAQVQVVGGTTSECRQLIEQRAADIGLFPSPAAATNLSRLAFHRHGLSAIVPPEHPLCQFEQLTPQQLIHYPLIAYRRNSFTQEYVNAVFRHAGLAPKFDMEMATGEHICSAVQLALGIGFTLTDDILPAEQRYRLIPVAGTQGDIIEHLVWLKTRSQQQGVREFVQMAMEQRQQLDFADQGFSLYSE